MSDTPQNPRWTVQYEFDGGPEDNHRAWWTVTDGKRRFDCEDKADADWLLWFLNESERITDEALSHILQMAKKNPPTT